MTRNIEAADRLQSDDDALPRGITVVICTYNRGDKIVGAIKSLERQTRRADRLVIVDASAGDATRVWFADYAPDLEPAAETVYLHVGGDLRGLTRQRNFSFRYANTDLIVFFDDDVALEPDCLAEMEKCIRASDDLVGSGAYILDATPKPDLNWRCRRMLGIVPGLQPGRYHNSGMSIPWSFLPLTDQDTEGDWLPGCCMMWRTAVAKRVGFNNAFHGYSQGEDLDFSLGMRRRGRLVMAGRARLRHYHEPSGRPNHFQLGYMAVHNRYQIHRRGIPNRRARDVAWFIYAWSLDTVLYARHFLWPSRFLPTCQSIAGRFRATYDLLVSASRRNPD